MANGPHLFSLSISPPPNKWLILFVLAAIGLAGSGTIVILSTNVVDADDPIMSHWHFEPSSADTGNWVTSWHEIVTQVAGVPSDVHGYTRAWNGSSWQNEVEHSPGDGGHCIDTYLNFDAFRNRFVLVCLQWGGWPSLYYRYSTNSQGTAWGSWKLVLAGDPPTNIRWDYPSIAVNSSGRLVIGVSKVNPGNAGYWTVVSTNGGDTWQGPYQVGTLLGEISRIAVSQTGFHAFIMDRSNPADYKLYRYGSSDGVSWPPNGQLVNHYGAPLRVSPGKYSPSCPNRDRPCNCSGTNCGVIGYAAEPDAVGASSSIGWVVAFPVNINGLNAINVHTEFGGGVTITHVTDLFLHGITTTAAGDWWLSYHTFSDTTNPNRYLPLKVGVVYRTAGSPPTYLGKVLTDTVRPNRGWFWWNTPGAHCANVAACFIAGDYMRPASALSTLSSIPWIRNSTSLQTDMMQAFLQDPEDTEQADFLPNIEPCELGADLRYRAALTGDHWEQHKFTGEPVVSSMAYMAEKAVRETP